MGGWSTPRPGRFTPRKYPVPTVLEAGWASGPVWTDVENLVPTGTRSPDLPARNVVAIPNELSRNQTVSKSNMTARVSFSVNSYNAQKNVTNRQQDPS